MCMVSAVSDYGLRIPLDQWTVPGYESYRTAIEAARKFDEASNQPHCEDPEKVALLERIEEKLGLVADRLDIMVDRLDSLDGRLDKVEKKPARRPAKAAWSPKDIKS